MLYLTLNTNSGNVAILPVPERAETFLHKTHSLSYPAHYGFPTSTEQVITMDIACILTLLKLNNQHKKPNLLRISILDTSKVSYTDIFEAHIPIKTRIYSETTHVYANNTIPSVDAKETILMTLSTHTIRCFPSIYYRKTFNKQKITTATTNLTWPTPLTFHSIQLIRRLRAMNVFLWKQSEKKY